MQHHRCGARHVDRVDGCAVESEHCDATWVRIGPARYEDLLALVVDEEAVDVLPRDRRAVVFVASAATGAKSDAARKSVATRRRIIMKPTSDIRTRQTPTTRKNPREPNAMGTYVDLLRLG